MFSKNIFSQRILNLRTDNKLTQSQLGEIAGISCHAISKIEKSKRSASIEVIQLIADYFDVSIDYLVGRTDNPNSHKN